MKSESVKKLILKKGNVRMKRTYPIYISHDDEGYYATLPDFKNHTEGDSLEDVMYMAKDAICSLAMTKEDLGRPIPDPFSVDYTPEPDETIAYIDIDFGEKGITAT